MKPRKKSFIFVAMLLFIIFCSLVSAVEININKEVFNAGETVLIDIIIKNEKPTNKELLVEYSIGHEGNFIVTPGLNFVEFLAGETKTVKYSFGVRETTAPGDYFINVKVVDEQDNLVGEATKTFKVVGTKKRFEIIRLVCSDEECRDENKVFIKGDKAYIKVESDVKDLTINGKLRKPDGNEVNLIFENNLASVVLDKIGNYKALIEASKEGYHKANSVVEFGVIEKEPTIKTGFELKPVKRFPWFLLLMIIFLLIVFLLIYYKFQKPETKLKGYIKKELKKGFTIKQVRKKLKEAGWSDNLVNKVVEKLK